IKIIVRQDGRGVGTIVLKHTIVVTSELGNEVEVAVVLREAVWPGIGACQRCVNVVLGEHLRYAC
ncbi:MAG: hypothetical protein AAF438_17450, partial [Pseudomonadota bacterium]